MVVIEHKACVVKPLDGWTQTGLGNPVRTHRDHPALIFVDTLNTAYKKSTGC